MPQAPASAELVDVTHQAPLARKALAGLFLSGMLFSFPGAILPVWRHHLTGDYMAVGNYFLAMTVGVIAALLIDREFLGRWKLSHILVLACATAYSAFFFLALVPSAYPAAFRVGGLLGLGLGAGLLDAAVFRAISPLYRHDPAATISLAGTFFGAGCVVTALLVAGTFYAYTVSSIMVLFGLIPALFCLLYARAPATADRPAEPSWRQAFQDFRSPGAVMFTLLLFFQFGNEWSIAGWMAVFLIQRLGISPELSLVLLAMYWASLLVGRIVVLSILPSVHHGKLLMGSALAALFGCTILSTTNNRFGAITGILLVGCGFASVYPLVVEKLGKRFPYYHPGFFNGIFAFALTGGLLAPWSLGLFTSWWGIRAVMGLPLLGTVMVVVLLLLIWAEAKFLGD